MSYNPGGRFGGGSDDDSGTDRSDRGTGRGGTSPDGPAGVDDPDPAPPEDDNDPNPGGRFGGPPEDDGFEPPDRSGPPEDSGEEAGRVDNVTDPSPPPGSQFDRPDRRGPSERDRQRTVATELDNITQDDIADVSVSRGEITDVDLTESARVDLAREQFAEQRDRARQNANVDDPTVSNVGAYEPSELNFEPTGGGSFSISPTEDAVRRRENEVTRQRVTEQSITDQVDPGAVVDDRVDESDEPGRVAGAIDRLTDEIAAQNPAARTGIAATAASLRTETGVGPLPGGDDVDEFRDAFAGSAQTIDDAISSGVDRLTLDPSNAPAGLGDVPLRDPADAAVAATLGTEAGRRGARTGIEAGLQSLNPAEAAQDAATFAEFGVRGTDRLLRADEQEIQRGLDVAEAGGEAARDVGPPVAAAALAERPSRGFAVGAGAATIGAASLAGPAAAGRGARAAARASDDALDGTNVARFLRDDRGQLDFGRRTDTDTDTPDDSVTIGGEDVSGVRNPADPSRGGRFGARRTGGRSPDDPGRAVDPDPDAGTGTDTGSGLGFRSAETETRTADTFRSTPEEPDFGGLTGATQRLDGDFSVPRDPLDTRPGSFGPPLVAGVLGTGTAADTATATQRLVEQAQGSDLDTTPSTGLDVDAGSGLGFDTGLGVGSDTDTGVGPDTDTGLGVGEDTLTGADEDLFVGASTRVGTQTTPQTTPQTRQDLRTGLTTDLGTTTGFGTRIDIDVPNIPRPPTIPTLPDDEDDDERLRVARDADDRTFDSGIQSAEEAFGGDPFADIDEDKFIGR